jgi:molybdenum cofactor cytidylyltransferase
MTPAIVLAAGASTRMGRPKALLEAGDRTFVRRILDTLRAGGVADLVVVVRPGHEQLIREVEASGLGRTVLNPRADEGQLSSLIAGLDALDQPGIDAVLVTLVDVPLIGPDAVRLLLSRAAASSAPVVRAVHQGRHGHPVIFKRELFEALRRADPAAGAKAVVRAVQVEDVETGDPGVVEDVDTPEEYARLFGIDPSVNRGPSNP